MRTSIRTAFKFASAALVALVVGGCSFVQPIDPNAPAVLAEQPDRILERVGLARRMADFRIQSGDATPAQAEAVFQSFVRDMLSNVDPATVPAEDAWKYGDAYRSAGDWETAYLLYSVALDVAPNQDRRVNDSLRLARAATNLGRHDEAIELSASVFDAPAPDKAPILPAILKEIVPETECDGCQAALAELLEGAIDQHMQVIVDPTSAPGQQFFAARPFLIEDAYVLAIRLYEQAGATEQARAAAMRYDAMSDSFGVA